jgi:hypothetical protein
LIFILELPTVLTFAFHLSIADFGATLLTDGALFGALLHLHVVAAHSDTIIGAAPANRRAGSADSLVQSRAANHEISAGLTNLRAIGQ